LIWWGVAIFAILVFVLRDRGIEDLGPRGAFRDPTRDLTQGRSLMLRSPPPTSAQDETITAPDGRPLKAWRWVNERPRAVLVISHGLGEHAACYSHVAEGLGSALGIDVLAFDFRGHGRSPGRRGLVRKFEDLTGDLGAALSWAGRARPGLPRFVLGHSNGGLVALRLILEQEAGLAGLILSNPALRLAQPVPRHKRLAGAILRRCAPGVTLATAIGPELMTRDPDVLAGRAADSLRHTRISAPIFYGMVEGGPLVALNAARIRTPVLMVLGGADPVIDSRESRAVFERLGSEDKSLRVYPGMLHEPLNDIGREQVLSDIAEWIAVRLPNQFH
jgi:alpha-beta hydrolase superfamily lysophospholipase